MEHKYLGKKDDGDLPPYDEAITEWLNAQPDSSVSVPYKILICNRNVMYRTITCHGLGEYVAACQFLGSQGLVDTSEYGKGLKGYDSVFLSQDYINKASSADR